MQVRSKSCQVAANQIYIWCDFHHGVTPTAMVKMEETHCSAVAIIPLKCDYSSTDLHKLLFISQYTPQKKINSKTTI